MKERDTQPFPAWKTFTVRSKLMGKGKVSIIDSKIQTHNRNWNTYAELPRGYSVFVLTYLQHPNPSSVLELTLNDSMTFILWILRWELLIFSATWMWKSMIQDWPYSNWHGNLSYSTIFWMNSIWYLCIYSLLESVRRI